MPAAPAPGSPLPGDPPSGPALRAIFLRVFPSIALPMFLAAVDQTIIATALPAIAADLGGVERLSWIVVAYLVAGTIAAPAYGRLGDALGRRRMLLGALALFIGASICCALAPSVEWLTVARVVQGFGGGGLMTLSQALVGEAVPARQRGRFQGYLATIFLASSTFGPVMGGIIAEQFGWRAVFLINLPLGIAAALLALRLPRPPPVPAPQLSSVLDLPGLALFAASITAALVALEALRAPRLASLLLAALLLPLAAVLLVLLLRRQRQARAPLLPIALLRQPGVWRADVMAICTGATLVSLVSFLPLYLQVARGVSPAASGLMLLPLTAGLAVGALITGRIMSRTGRSMIIPSVGSTVTALLIVLLAIALPSLPTAALPWCLALLAPFLGTVMTVVQTTVQVAAGGAQLGAAASSVQLSRSIGAAFGAAITGAVLFAAAAAIAPDAKAMADFLALLQGGPGALALLTPEAAAVAKAEMAGAFRAALLAVAGFAAIGAVMAWTNPLRRIE